MPMNEQSLSIFNGVDACSSPHTLGSDQVQTASNVDFSLQRGAALTRRGSIVFSSAGGTNPLITLYRPPKINSLFSGEDSAPYYLADVQLSGTTVQSNTIYRGTLGTSTITNETALLTLTGNPGYPIIPMGLYNNYTLIAGPNQQNYKDDGSLTTQWVKQSPSGTLTLGSATLAPIPVCGTSIANNQWTVVSTQTYTFQGTATNTWTNTSTVSAGTFSSTFTFTNKGTLQPWGGTSTFTTTVTFTDVVYPLSTGSNTATFTDTATYTNTSSGTATFTGTATGTVDATTYTVVFQAQALNSNLDTNAGNVIGDYGFDSIQIALSDPSKVISIGKAYSIGDASFTNYYYAPMDLSLLVEAVPFDSSQLRPVTSTNAQGVPRVLFPGAIQPQIGIGRGGNGFGNTGPSQTPISQRQTSLSAALQAAEVSWVTARPNFTVIGNTPSSDGWADVQAARIIVQCQGGVGIPLVNCQITNWQIFGATNYPLTDLANGYYYWQTWATLDSSGNVIDESANSPQAGPMFVQAVQGIITATDSPTGTNHGITHRLFYREGGLASLAYRVGSATLTSGTQTFTDTTPDIISIDNNFQLVQGLYSQSNMPTITCLSEPYQSRIFYGWGSNVGWSLPGMVGEFPQDNVAGVSDEVDWPQSLHTWDRLVIVNRASVYEMAGSTFEGTSQDWTLQRTGSRRGCIAPKTCIKTPYGILLFDYDGFSIYYPGRGIDSPITWANEKLADAFRGTGTSDPAALKGNLIPAINWNGYVGPFASAAFQDDKLFVALPTGTATMPNTVFVLDFRVQNVWWYTYPFNITSLMWDKPSNRLLAGTDVGTVMRIETGYTDTTTSGSPQGIGWGILTRVWTAPQNSVIENLAAEVTGTGTTSLILDGTTTLSLSTFSNATKNWSFFPSLNTATITYTATQFGPNGSATYSTVTETNPSITNPIIGKNLSFYTQGTEPQGNPNGVFNFQWHAIEEPPNVNYLRTEMSPGGAAITDQYSNTYDEKIWDEQIVTMEAFGTGTISGLVYVDDVVVMTHTMVAPFGRQTFVKSFPPETKGFLSYTVWNGPGTPNNYTGSFKHYKNYTRVRKEPERITSFVTDKKASAEQWYQQVLTDVDPLGGTVLGTVFVNGTATYTCTLTGSTRQQRPYALPSETYGTIIWVVYNGSSVFKHYGTEFKSEPEPERVLFYETPVRPLPSENYCKTWLPELNCLGGTCTGTALVEVSNGIGTYTAVMTNTFTGSIRNIYEVGYGVGSEELQTGKTIKATYSSTTPFKHYKTDFELDQKPFGKTTWFMYFNKIGGADEMDLGRFYKYDLEVPLAGTATVTSFWDVDDITVCTNTLTITGRVMSDPQPFPPGVRGYLWQQRLVSSVPFQTWSTTLQSERIGVKGLNNIKIPGSPIKEQMQNA